MENRLQTHVKYKLEEDEQMQRKRCRESTALGLEGEVTKVIAKERVRTLLRLQIGGPVQSTNCCSS